MKMYLKLFVLIIIWKNTEVLADNERVVQKRNSVNLKDVEKPLFLTPLIERKNIAGARERARVYHSEINIESYSGYFTVNKDFNSNLFFWYFPSKGNTSTDPLILWLQGGPGTTSLVGVFVENGPFEVTEMNTLAMRNITWVNNHNVLYIDSPVGTGFSFTDNEAGYATTTNHVAQNLYIALQQFFDLFAELRKSDFYVMSESYGGKYAPVLSHVIQEANKNSSTQNKINLVGFAIGNGWTDPINQLVYSKYLYHIGLIDGNGKKQLRKLEARIKDLIKADKYTDAFNWFMTQIVEIKSGLISRLSGFHFFYNYLYDKEPASYRRFVKWTRKSTVREALHVGNRQSPPWSENVSVHMSDDFLRSVAELVPTLLENYRVLLYFGQLDILCPISIAENYLKRLNWSGVEEYKKSVRKLWYVENQFAGYTKSARNLTTILVRTAGHMVPADKPLWAWNMITQFTRRKSW